MQNRGPTVLTVTVVMVSLSTVFIALRLVSRIGVVRRVSNDDYAIILAWVGNFESYSAVGAEIDLKIAHRIRLLLFVMLQHIRGFRSA